MIVSRIATLVRPRQLEFKTESISPDALSEKEVICETLVSVISPGTELAAYTGAPPLRPGITYPRLVGYCNVARVTHCCSGVELVRAGDRILTFSSHRSHFRAVESDVLCVLPKNMRSENAACAYLYHLGYNAVLKSEVRPGTTVVVLGLGVLGLCTVAMATLAGARVYGISDHATPRELANAMGARECFERARLPALRSTLGEDRAQVVITTSNRWNDWRTALECAGYHGTITVLGFPGRTEKRVPFNPLDSAHFYSRQLRIVAAGQSPEKPDVLGLLTFNQKDNLQRILGWIEEGRLQPNLLISGEFAGEDIALAYEQLLSRKDSPVTYLLRWSD